MRDHFEIKCSHDASPEYTLSCDPIPRTTKTRIANKYNPCIRWIDNARKKNCHSFETFVIPIFKAFSNAQIEHSYSRINKLFIFLLS